MIKLLIFIVAGGYVWGAWKFWKGYENTTFQKSITSKISLSLLWPVLIIANPSYRQNFQKALKGRY